MRLQKKQLFGLRRCADVKTCSRVYRLFSSPFKRGLVELGDLYLFVELGEEPVLPAVCL